MIIDEYELCQDCFDAHEGMYPIEGHTPECEPLSLINLEERQFLTLQLDEDGEIHYHFGKYPCEGCGSRLWGNRFVYDLNELEKH